MVHREAPCAFPIIVGSGFSGLGAVIQARRSGFRASDFLAPMRVVGRDGAELQERGHHGAKAYLGMTVPGFPNFFVMYGPNTNLGGNSIIYMIECQMRYLDGALRHLKRMRALAVRQDVFARFNEELRSCSGALARLSGLWAAAAGTRPPTAASRKTGRGRPTSNTGARGASTRRITRRPKARQVAL